MARVGFEPTSPRYYPCWQEATVPRAAIPFHMPLCFGSGNQLFYPHFPPQRARCPYPLGQAITACNPVGHPLLEPARSSLSCADDRIGNFISRYTVYFRTLGAICTSKGSVIVCSLLKLGSHMKIPRETHLPLIPTREASRVPPASAIFRSFETLG